MKSLLHLLVPLLVFAFATPASAHVIISGNLSGTLTVAGGSPYLVGPDGIIQPGDTLIVEAGVKVEFAFNRGLIVWGTLISQGTLGQEVEFAGYRDIGDPTLPPPGYWKNILIQPGAVVELSHTRVLVGGGLGAPAVYTPGNPAASVVWNNGQCLYSANDGMVVRAENLQISGVEFADNAGLGADLTVVGTSKPLPGVLVTATAAGSFTNLIASNNEGDGLNIAADVSVNVDQITADNNVGHGLTVTTSVPPILGQVSASDNLRYPIRLLNAPGSIFGPLSGTGNKMDGIYVDGVLGGSAPGATWTWNANSGFPMIVNSLAVGSGDVLSVAPNAVVKFLDKNAGLSLTGGKLLTAGPGMAYFTSIRDDLHGGDTNLDGTDSYPTPGDWAGIEVRASSQVDLKNTALAYGGSGGTANLRMKSGDRATSLVWDGGTSVFSAGDGVQVVTQTASLTNFRAAENYGDGVRLDASVSASVGNCDFERNTGSGLVNERTSPDIVAESCWWGDASGPSDPSAGPPDQNFGSGQPVSDDVDYRPWSGAPTNTNTNPTAFSLVSPLGGALTIFTQLFQWTASSDPNADPFTYLVQISQDPGFSQGTVSWASGISPTSFTFPPGAGGVGLNYWRVFAVDSRFGTRLSSGAAGTFTLSSVGLPDETGIAGLRMGPVVPNPARGPSRIDFSLQEARFVRAGLYDARGRLVRSLPGGVFAPGEHSLHWDGHDDLGRSLVGGVYFFRVQAGSESLTRRVVLAR